MALQHNMYGSVNSSDKLRQIFEQPKCPNSKEYAFGLRMNLDPTGESEQMQTSLLPKKT